MGRAVSLVLAVLMAGCATAHAADGAQAADGAKKPPKVERWERVERLQPGAEINVLAGNQSAPDLCLVASADDLALTCLAEDAPPGTRLVFPRSAVRDVWVIDEAPERHVGLWIGIALSAALEIWAAVAGGGGGAVLMAVLLGGAWAAAEDPRPGPFWFPPPPRRPTMPQWRRRLVYRAPLGAVTP